MENLNLLDCLRILQANSAEMTKKQEEEDFKKQKYEIECEESLRSISDFQEQNTLLRVEIRDLKEKIPTIKSNLPLCILDSLTIKLADIDTLLRSVCLPVNRDLPNLETEMSKAEKTRKDLEEALTISENVALIEETDAETNKKLYDTAMFELNETKREKNIAETRLENSRKKARELIAEVKSLKEKQQQLISTANAAHVATLANRTRIDSLAKQLKEREEKYKELMRELNN